MTAAAEQTVGECASRFEPVRAEFQRNFAERDELGASVCVIVDGEVVVDLWGGVADPSTDQPWERETVNVVMSCSKGATALCGNILIDRGELDPDATIASYWPEFGQNGKGQIPVRMAFNHQSGVAHVTETVPEGGLTDWERCITMIERTAPFWAPGERHGYHALTIGYIVGELVRRITGSTIGAFFREEVADPLGVDFWIGLPEEQEHRVATSVPFDYASGRAPADVLTRMADPSLHIAPLLANTGGWIGSWDTRAAHAAEIPAAGAITNARGLAGMYAPLSLDGSNGDVRLVRPEAIAPMRKVQSAGRDAVFGGGSTYTMGFSNCWWGGKPGDGSSVILGEEAFGTPGFGGQIGFADQSYRLAFGYTMNRHGAGTGINERGQSLIDAVYRVLGSPTNEPGFWVRR